MKNILVTGGTGFIGYHCLKNASKLNASLFSISLKNPKKFRKVRAIQRDVFGTLNSIELVNYLDKYAETGKEYTKILKQIIKQNNLTDFDNVKLLPSSIQLKNLI